MRRFIKANLASIISLTIIGLFLYVFNLHVPLFWDDLDWIVNNPVVHTLGWNNISFIFTHNVLAGVGGVSNYYRPLLLVSLAVSWVISGTNPILYHVVNNLIHVANGILIFYLLLRWLKSKRVAFIGALLFLTHPLQVEAFTYISGRADPMSVFFMLAGIILYLKNQKWLAAVAGILAIFTRETAVLFPLYLGAALMAFEYSGALWVRFKKSLLGILPFLGISVGYGILRLTVLNFQNTLNFYQQQNIYSEHLLYRIYTFFHALAVYFQLIMWPTGLHMDRDIAVNTSVFQWPSWFGAVLIVGLLCWLTWLYKKGKREVFNIWFFGLGIFFLNLGPSSGIIPINARILEHWLYFSLFGAFTIVAFYINQIWSWIEDHKPDLVPAFVIALVTYCLFLSIQTIRMNLLWGDTEVFYKNILAYEPQDVRVLNNLAMWYSDHSNDTAAVPLYEQAIQADPSQPAPYFNLGNIAANANQLDQAEKLYKKSLELDPNFHYAYQNLAQLYVYEKHYAEALSMLQKLQQIYPSDQTATNIVAVKKLIAQ